ncbi:MAG: hypothetical protein JWM64_295 [Frankiales bacterium]|nr:hypothetical protein [Frankiales bacterium]
MLAVVGVTSDTLGTLLCLPAALASLAVGLRDLLVVPALQADASGLQVRPLLGVRSLRWDDVVRLRVVQDRRAVLLELELEDDEVLLLSRGRLGRDPRDVLDELEALRPR